MKKQAISIPKQYHNLLYTLVFGVLSLLFSLLQFRIPGMDGAVSDMREIPLLVSVCYISNPIYLIGAAATTSLNTPEGGSALSSFLMHLPGMLFCWYAYRGLLRLRFRATRLAVAWAIVVVVYFALIVVPLMVVTNKLVGINTEADFFFLYFNVMQNLPFEITSSVLVSTMVVLQIDARASLLHYSERLEVIVKARTRELHKTIQHLHQSNQELESLNGALDELVFERTRQLEKRNAQLAEYAFINSHLLRAPLARLLGLSTLFEMQKKGQEVDRETVQRFIAACHELDQIINLIAQTLTQESDLDHLEIEALKEKAREITEKASKKSRDLA